MIVVGLDQQTVQQTGFPVPREHIAQVQQRLGDAGAAVIAWDILFATPREGDAVLAAAFAAGHGESEPRVPVTTQRP